KVRPPGSAASAPPGTSASSGKLRPPAALPAEAPALPPSSISLMPVAGQQDSSSSISAPPTSRRRGVRRVVTSIAGLAMVAGVLALYLSVASRTSTEAGEAIAPPPRLRPAQGARTEPAALPAAEGTQTILSEAEDALGRGDHARAIELARSAVPAPQAWRVIAIAACKM